MATYMHGHACADTHTHAPAVSTPWRGKSPWGRSGPWGSVNSGLPRKLSLLPSTCSFTLQGQVCVRRLGTVVGVAAAKAWAAQVGWDSPGLRLILGAAQVLVSGASPHWPWDPPQRPPPPTSSPITWGPQQSRREGDMSQQRSGPWESAWQAASPSKPRLSPACVMAAPQTRRGRKVFCSLSGEGQGLLGELKWPALNGPAGRRQCRCSHPGILTPQQWPLWFPGGRGPRRPGHREAAADTSWWGAGACVAPRGEHVSARATSSSPAGRARWGKGSGSSQGPTLDPLGKRNRDHQPLEFREGCCLLWLPLPCLRLQPEIRAVKSGLRPPVRSQASAGGPDFPASTAGSREPGHRGSLGLDGTRTELGCMAHGTKRVFSLAVPPGSPVPALT